jgi:phosphoserine phosphatase
MAGLVIFDCDSTLSGIEGVDELGRLRGDAVFAAAERMTRDAMDGGVPLEQVFAKRLELIRPTTSEMDAVGRLYLRHLEPSAEATVRELRALGWELAIVSGGFSRAIAPLAELLGIQRVEAVGVRFDAHGNYLDFDRDAPTTRGGGKNQVVRILRAGLQPGSPIVLVGDGASDLETRPDVNLFIGFGGFVDRPKVRSGAEVFVTALSAVPALLRARFGTPPRIS